MIDVNLSLAPKQFKLIQNLIYQHAGIALPDSKQTMVQGRLAKRLRALKLDSYDQYISHLEKDNGGQEQIEFINCLTTNKTDFFRENHHFRFLSDTLLPELKPALEGGSQKLRIWSAACSTGEEPYSIAMTLRESLRDSVDMCILASDIDTAVLERCQAGCYPADRVVDVPKYLLHRYFDKQKDHSDEANCQWRVKNSLRDMIRFRRINFQDSQWPIQTKFDVIFCRNVMIYFDTETQRKLVERFASYLQPEGHLIIGHSETLSGINNNFELVGNTVYRLKPGVNERTSSSETLTKVSSSVTAAAAVPAKTTARSTPASSNAPQVKRATTGFSPTKEPVHPIIVGEIYGSYESKWISTLLGSCVSACLYDDRMQIGGMNHFMLPLGSADSTTCASYGVHAMEMLINALMKLGADRRRLKAKLFGGGAVIRTSETRWNVGERNIDFAKKFLEAEAIPLIASHTGGTQAMHIRFHTRTHKALVRVLDDRLAADVVEVEKRQPKPQSARDDAVTLF
ncbi:MAG: hypothetical protein IT423_04115 [Pirellulaceae bacterium]|nr:hypothetical protein [Pirellulaceae bacterium]